MEQEPFLGLKVFYCDGLPSKAPTYNADGSLENDGGGDSMLWAGLVHFAESMYKGTAYYNKQLVDRIESGISRSQDMSGRIWRNPKRVLNDKEDSFSRDMAIGLCLYAINCDDLKVFSDWVKYSKNHSVFGIPTLFPAKESSDTRHLFSPNLMFLINMIIDFRTGKRIGFFGFFVYWATLFVSALFGSTGYAMHLIAVQCMAIERIVSKEQKVLCFLNRIICDVLSLRQSMNPFFKTLSSRTSDEVRSSFLLLCLYCKEFFQNKSGYFQWFPERDTEGKAWLNSMGWDFYFMFSLFSKNDGRYLISLEEITSLE